MLAVGCVVWPVVGCIGAVVLSPIYRQTIERYRYGPGVTPVSDKDA